MTLTTLIYLIKDNKYLMLHRTKKENDINAGKYIGVGGHVEEGESPFDCIKREVMEETGLVLNSAKFRGYITFVMGKETEHASLFTSEDFSGNLVDECKEGELAWVDIDKVMDLNLWEGDRAFLKLLNETDDFFSLKLVYDEGDNLMETILETATIDSDVEVNTSAAKNLEKLEAKAERVHQKAQQIFEQPEISSMLKNEYKNKIDQYTSMYESIDTMKKISDKEETIANLVNQQIEILNVRIKWELDWANRAICFLRPIS